MEKPGPDASPWEHLAYGMCQIDDERKEACIHCGEVWYAIHHKDGVCHECQRKKLPGRGEMARREAEKRNAIIIFSATVILLAVGLLYF